MHARGQAVVGGEPGEQLGEHRTVFLVEGREPVLAMALREITGVPEGAHRDQVDWTDIRPRFDEYELQIRREYGWVPDNAFREARSKILRSLLERPSVYATPTMRQRCEAQARANLERSLARLDE